MYSSVSLVNVEAKLSEFIAQWNARLGKRDFPTRNMNSELRFHIDDSPRKYMRQDMCPKKPSSRHARFRRHENLKEQVRDVYRIRLVDATLANLKSASASSVNLHFLPNVILTLRSSHWRQQRRFFPPSTPSS